MQRKPTPLSHPFHALFQRLVFSLALTVLSLSAWASDPLFHIQCPPDTTVDCNAELWDLSIYGNAWIFGYGDPQPAGPPVSTEYHLNSCNVGNIIRTWVAYDYGGNPFYCSQTITVTGGGTYADIHWPPDYTIHSCNPQTDPEDLPPPYDHPVIDGGGGSCAQLLTNHEDQVFDINPPACRKILRKWTIIDWCSYDPNSWDPQGIWQYTQIIKIKPENPPKLWCPSDTTISAGADCTGGYVQLPPAHGSSDCGAEVLISNNSPYAYSHGADASGMYPIGTTKVSFWADDKCGQTASCSMYVTVKDMKQPTPVCYYGISVSLMQMPDGYYMNLRPSFFNKGSFDNCTPKDELKMWVEPASVGCADLGATDVRLYVEDESGNVDYCNTVVYVQDNMGMCPPMDGDITGTIHTDKGNSLKEVKVSLMGTPAFAMTDAGGQYAFSSMAFGKSYTISPAYPMDDLQGVSALDLAALLKQILGIEKFTSPYQYIAADLDKSGRVSVNDLIALKELILKEYLGLHPETSWRFVDASYTFQNPQDPLAESFPESYQIQSLTEDMQALDFVGVKLGDINADATALTSGGLVLSRSNNAGIIIPDQTFSKGEKFEATVFVRDYQQLAAMQCAITLDPDALQLTGITPLQNDQGLDMIDRTADYHMVSILWYGAESLKSCQLCKMTFQAVDAGVLSSALHLATTAEALAYWSGSANPVGVDLEYGASPLDEGPVSETAPPAMHLGQNYPNPFGSSTIIPVDLPDNSGLQVTVFDVSGRELYTMHQDGIKGWQEIQLDFKELQMNGILLCRITSKFGSGTVRMILKTAL